jgi:hypothetical protein
MIAMANVQEAFFRDDSYLFPFSQDGLKFVASAFRFQATRISPPTPHQETYSGSSGICFREPNYVVITKLIVSHLYIELYFSVNHNNIPINSFTYHCA